MFEIEFWLVLKSPKISQYQSYSSNWYVNVKVFTRTAAWEPKNVIFFSKQKEHA